MKTTATGILTNFKDLQLCDRFYYPETYLKGKRVWAVYNKCQEQIDGPMCGSIAEVLTDAEYKAQGKRQSLCTHDARCPRRVYRLPNK